jgi:hypothetical protein
VIGGAGSGELSISRCQPLSLFRSELRLEPVSGRHDVLAYRFLMQTGVDRQEIVDTHDAPLSPPRSDAGECAFYDG